MKQRVMDQFIAGQDLKVNLRPLDGKTVNYIVDLYGSNTVNDNDGNTIFINPVKK